MECVRVCVCVGVCVCVCVCFPIWVSLGLSGPQTAFSKPYKRIRALCTYIRMYILGPLYILPHIYVHKPFGAHEWAHIHT